MRRFLIAIDIMLYAATAVHAQDELSGILQQIETNNIQLKAALHDGEADVLDIKAENSVSGPSVEYSPFFKSGYGGIAESELIIKEDIAFPSKYAARNRLAELQRESSRLNYERQRRDILLQARLLCIDIIRSNQLLQMLQQRLANSETLDTMYRKRLEAGDANILDVNKVRLDCMEVRTLCCETENERSALLQQLQQLNGGNAITLTSSSFPVIAVPGSIDELLSRAMATDAGIREAEANIRVQRQGVSISRKEWLPDLSLGYRRNTEMKESVNGFVVGAAFPIFGNGNKVRAAQHRQQSAELLLLQLQEERKTALRSRYNELLNLQRILDHSDIEMMQQMLQLLSKALQHGEINALQYYAETNSIYEKIQRHIEVHSQMVKIQAELTAY